MTASSPPNEALSSWLRLREAADATSRSAALVGLAVRACARAGAGPIQVLDLGTGAGSNLRYLITRLPPRQRWLVVDRGQDLLADLLSRTAPWAAALGLSTRTTDGRLTITGDDLECVIETRQMDLGPLADTSIFDGRHLVTASALLDLVSNSWLARVAACTQQQGATALFSLTYNGHSTSDPEDAEDAFVLDLFNQHQRTDKGLGGPATGPGATEAARRAFEDAGFVVQIEPSDWTLGTHAGEMQRYLLDGWASAAIEMEPYNAVRISHWRQRRLAHVDARRSQLSIGHYDLAATQRDSPARSTNRGLQ
jgi:hypothetical protein